MIRSRSQLFTDVRLYLFFMSALIIIGLLFIYSASSVFAMERLGVAHYFVRKQCIGLILGLICFGVVQLFPYTIIKNMAPYLLVLAWCLTLLTFIPAFAFTIHGSSRWLNIMGFSFQPSDLLKYALLLYTAYFLDKKEHRLTSFSQGYLPFWIVNGITALILLKQPDFGLTVTLLATTFSLFFIMQKKTRYTLLTIAILIPLICVLVYTQPYRVRRILTFLNPWKDPQGAGFQIIQSLIALGTGHWFGVGVSHSKQKFFYLPMQHTDFIFSIIGEETGFIGCLLLLFIYVLVLIFGVRISLKLKHQFNWLVVIGFTFFITTQTIINTAVASGLLPTKGIGLPFISYGNSFLITVCMYLGIVVQCIRNDHKTS